MEALRGSVLIVALTENALCGIKDWQVAKGDKSRIFHIPLFVTPLLQCHLYPSCRWGQRSVGSFFHYSFKFASSPKRGHIYVCPSNNVQCLSITCFHLSPHFFPSQQFVYMTNHAIVSQATKPSTNLIRYRFKDVATSVWARENKCLDNNLQNSSAECPIYFKEWCIFTSSLYIFFS